MKLKDYAGKTGICMSCKEWTEITEPCCGDPVQYEGGWISLDDFDDEDDQLTEECDEMAG